MKNPEEKTVPAKTMLNFILNGKPCQAAAGSTVTDLLIRQKARPELLIVEINGSILQKLDYETTQIYEGDSVECVFYIGGGSVKTCKVILVMPDAMGRETIRIPVWGLERSRCSR